MHLRFLKVKIKNFLSFGEAEINLENLGYVLVKGENHFPKDNSLSNGAGKSAFSSAICWALTGETINGLTQNLKNINIPEKECYVSLDFIYDGKQYKLTRYKEPKPDLKIFINGNDCSGKTLKDSDRLLSQFIPDLSSKLIASVIILGQGLPYKFSNNTPSGRKEVLEKLSKSDFMINDIKNRLSARSTILYNSKRKVEDEILIANSKINLLENQLKTVTLKLEELNNPHDFDANINSIKRNIEMLEKSVIERKNSINESTNEFKVLNESLNKLLEEKSNKLNEDAAEFNEVTSQYLTKKYKLQSDINALNSEINKLKAITDICPTCGQKIPGAKKPDTTEKEKELINLKSDLEDLNKRFANIEKQNKEFKEQINNEYKFKIEDISKKVEEKNRLNLIKNNELQSINNQILNYKNNLTKLEFEKQNHFVELEKYNKQQNDIKKDLKELQDTVDKNNKEKEVLINHVDVISRMETLTNRDFRGYLLLNIINYIDVKAKEYAKDIFNTDDLHLKLDRNDLDIIYCNKFYESLSGGEKQKVDLILQFAIRDMMVEYLAFTSNILVLDEITDNLDNIGSQNVLNLISTKISDIESIFIVSHHASELDIATDEVLTVIKDRNGVSYIK